MRILPLPRNAIAADSVRAGRGHAGDLLEAVWDRAPIGVFEGTTDGTITGVNQVMAEMLGYSRVDLLGFDVARLTDPSFDPLFRGRGGRAGLEEEHSAERRFVKSDGSLLPVLVSTAIVRGDDHSTDCFTSFVVDLSEVYEQRSALERALAELAEANAELARRQSFTDALLETIDVGIVFCDADAGSMMRNRAERRMVGLDANGKSLLPTDVLSRVDVLDVDGNRIPVERQPLYRLLRGEDLGDLDLKLGPTGGPHRDVIVRGSQIVGPDGTLHGAVVALHDVTHQRSVARALAQEHRKLLEAQQLGRIGSYSYDPRRRSFTFSDQLLLIWGLTPGADLERVARDLIHPDDRSVVESHWEHALAEGGHRRYDHRIVLRDGEVRHLHSDVKVTLDASGRALLVDGTNLDVTDLMSARESLQHANAFFQAVLTATPDYTFVTDLTTGALVYGTPHMDVLGITSKEIAALGSSVVSALVHPDDQDGVRASNRAASLLAEGEVHKTRYRARHADGDWRWLSRRVTPFRRDASGMVIETLGVLRDITDSVLAEDKLNHAALHDQLTGLPNRSLLVDRLEAALARSERDRREVTVLFCDLDGFKLVNDSAGHAAGDAMLRETARRLSSVLRENDTVARIGGDEFVVVLEPWNRAETAQPTLAGDRAIALEVAERIAGAVRQVVTIDGLEHLVSVSIGVAHGQLPALGEARTMTADQLLKDADAAMYLAKSGGGDRLASQ